MLPTLTSHQRRFSSFAGSIDDEDKEVDEKQGREGERVEQLPDESSSPPSSVSVKLLVLREKGDGRAPP